MNEDELSKAWRKRSLRYVEAMNRFIAQALREGLEHAGRPPRDARWNLAAPVLAAVRQANATGDLAELRRRFPPAHAPFVRLIEDHAECVSSVAILSEGRIAARIGAPHEDGRLVLLEGDTVTPFVGAFAFGRSRDRRVFAFASPRGVTTREGWDGPVIADFAYPTGMEGVPSGYDAELIAGLPVVERLVPFAEGSRVLLAGRDGIFVLRPEGVDRLLPTAADFREHFDRLREDNPHEALSMPLDMAHATVSVDGRLIAAGAQFTPHLVFRDGRPFASIGGLSEYAHHACFSSDDAVLALSSCHFYNGRTLGVPVSALKPGFASEPYAVNPPLVELERDARVYAAVHRGHEFILGDAGGALRAASNDGDARWLHVIGGTVADLDLTPDGKTLAVGTYAGTLNLLDLDTGEVDPFAIGTATHRERRRWVFWRNEKRPLLW